MGSKIEYVDSTQIYATRYARNSKAVGVLWAIFAICYAIIVVVSFVTPEWIGGDGTTTTSSSNLIADGGAKTNVDGIMAAKFGLWSTCRVNEVECDGKFYEFYKTKNVYFLVATSCVAVAVATALLAVVTMVFFFFFCHSTTVYHVCGWLQLISAAFLIAGCASYPVGWSDDEVRNTCGSTADRYNLGDCTVRWAYLLATIGCFDAIVLAALAFILATRHIRLLQAEPHYAPASLYKGEMNGAFVNDTASVAGSRKSLNLHPVLLMHPGQDDTYSQFSQRTMARSTHSGHYSHPLHHSNY